MPLTYDVADLAIHLVKLCLHLSADNAIRVACVVNAQVVTDQHIPGRWPGQQRQQMLRHNRSSKDEVIVDELTYSTHATTCFAYSLGMQHAWFLTWSCRVHCCWCADSSSCHDWRALHLLHHVSIHVLCSLCHVMSGVAAWAYLPHAIIHSVQIMDVKGRVGVRLTEHILGQLHPRVITQHSLHACSACQTVFHAITAQRTPVPIIA
jgi:hypothetical protein